MRAFLLAACPFLLPFFFLFHLCFTVLLLRRYRQKRETFCLLAGLVTLGLCLDAGVLALGAAVGEGPLLQTLSRLRFLSHGILIPLLFPICAEALGFGKRLRTAVWILTAALMLLGAAEAIATVLEPRELAGVCRYAAADATPGWARTVSQALSFGTVLPLILTGVVVLIRQKSPALLLGGFLMFAFSALGPATGNTDLIFLISMFGEAFMVLGFYLHAVGKRRTTRSGK